MTTPWFTSPAWLALVHALLHTLWLGALAAAGLFAALRIVPARRARLRCNLAMAALLFVPVLGFATWSMAHGPVPLVGAGAQGPASERRAADVGSPPTFTYPAESLANVGKLSELDMPGSPQWPKWVVAFWLTGVAACLARTARATWTVEKLRSRCTPLADPVLLALAEEVRQCLHLRQRVRLFVSHEIATPAMIGFVWPIILLPAAMLTGVPTDAWRAMLAHELAHVRRWDYLANLGQMLIEALLFFNPFVWWISRQVRCEREACCDRIAAEECGSPARYVHALAGVLERSRASGWCARAPLVGADGAGSVQDRARRLLVPGYLPEPRLRWFSVALLTASILVPILLSTGTPAIAQIRKAAETPAVADAAGDMLFKVMITTEDGIPIPENSAMCYSFTAMNSNGRSTAAQRVGTDGIATVWVESDVSSVTVAAIVPGYAPAFAGPFTAPLRETMAGLRLQLKRGFSAAVQLVDDAGQPILGGTVQAFYPGPLAIDGSKLTPDSTRTTDAQGIAVLDHLGPAPFNLRAVAAGYEGDTIAAPPLGGAKPHRWALKKAQAMAGKVIAAETEKPIAGATIKLAGIRGPHPETYADPSEAPLLATSDAGGAFKLASLRRDSRYFFFVDAPGSGGVFLREVELGTSELKVALGPELRISGKIINMPPSVIHMGKVNLQYGQTFQIGENDSHRSTKSQALEPNGVEVPFAVGPFWKVQESAAQAGDLRNSERSVGISVDLAGRADFSIADLPNQDVVLDLGPKAAPEALNVRGTISTPTGALQTSDGARVMASWTFADPKGGKAVGYSGSTIGYFEPEDQGRYSLTVPVTADLVVVSAQARGFATAYREVSKAQLVANKMVADFELVEGFSASVQVVDEAGRPVQGASVSAKYPGPPEMTIAEMTTDTAGMAALKHIGEAPLDVRVKAAGYQEEVARGLQLTAGQTHRRVLQHAEAVRGVVTAAATGEAIPLARIKLAGVRGLQTESYANPDAAPLLAVADAQGAFVLDTLKSSCTYYLFVEAPGFAGLLVGDVTSQSPALKPVMKPELVVTGRVINVSSKDIYGGKAFVECNQYFKIGETYQSSAKRIEVSIKDGEGTFVTKSLYEWPVVWQYGDYQSTKVELADFGKPGLVLDFGRRASAK